MPSNKPNQILIPVSGISTVHGHTSDHPLERGSGNSDVHVVPGFKINYVCHHNVVVVFAHPMLYSALWFAVMCYAIIEFHENT